MGKVPGVELGRRNPLMIRSLVLRVPDMERFPTRADAVTGDVERPCRPVADGPDEDLDAVLVNKLMDGVGGEGAASLPYSGGVFSPDANSYSLGGWGGRGAVRTTEAEGMWGTSEDGHRVEYVVVVRSGFGRRG